MNVQEWKHDWKRGRLIPLGPWDTEPDKIQWVDDETGLDCLIHRNRGGALCGYVGVSEGHPLFGVHFSSLGESKPEVHGGLTYSAFCEDTKDESWGICHIPAPDRPHKVWWLGFDCAHHNDYSPGYQLMFPVELRDNPVDYKDRVYVEQEVTKLAKQLKEMMV